METHLVQARLKQHDEQIQKLQADVAEIKQSLQLLEADRSLEVEFRQFVMNWMKQQDTQLQSFTPSPNSRVVTQLRSLDYKSGPEDVSPEADRALLSNSEGVSSLVWMNRQGKQAQSETVKSNSGPDEVFSEIDRAIQPNSDGVSRAVKEINLPELHDLNLQGRFQIGKSHLDTNRITSDLPLQLTKLSDYFLSSVPRLPVYQPMGYSVAGLRAKVAGWVCLRRPHTRLDAMSLDKDVEGFFTGIGRMRCRIWDPGIYKTSQFQIPILRARSFLRR